MTLPADVARCPGREIPFGVSYDDPECQTCARAKPTGNEFQWWMAAVEFKGECPSKINQGN